MNSIKTIGESQALSRFSSSQCSLSHNQQLESEERCSQRVNSLKIKAQRVKNTFLSLDEQIRWAYDLVINVLTPSQQETIGYIALMETQFDEVTVAYPTIGDNIKRSEKTVDRAMDKMRGLRLAFTMPRFVMRNGKMVRTSNRTWLNPIFRHPKLREMLKNVSTFLGHVFKQTPRFLSLWLLFSASKTSLQVENVPGEYIDIYINKNNVDKDITSREVKDTHSREVDITFSKESHLLPAREGDIQSREVIQEDIHSRDEVPMEDLSQKIAEMRKALEPQHAALKSRKAEAAREMSELLHGRVTANIHLSAKGQLHMMRYCDGALLYGLESLAHHGTIDNRTNYSLFEAACIEYSRRNEIEIDADKYDSLIRELGYVDSQPYCKKIILDAPLSKNKAYSPVTEKPQDPKPYIPPRHSEKKMYASLDPSLRDPIIALALRLGYEDRLDLPQISSEKLDLIE